MPHLATPSSPSFHPEDGNIPKQLNDLRQIDSPSKDNVEEERGDKNVDDKDATGGLLSLASSATKLNEKDDRAPSIESSPPGPPARGVSKSPVEEQASPSPEGRKIDSNDKDSKIITPTPMDKSAEFAQYGDEKNGSRPSSSMSVYSMKPYPGYYQHDPYGRPYYPNYRHPPGQATAERSAKSPTARNRPQLYIQTDRLDEKEWRREEEGDDPSPTASTPSSYCPEDGERPPEAYTRKRSASIEHDERGCCPDHHCSSPYYYGRPPPYYSPHRYPPKYHPGHYPGMHMHYPPHGYPYPPPHYYSPPPRHSPGSSPDPYYYHYPPYSHPPYHPPPPPPSHGATTPPRSHTRHTHETPKDDEKSPHSRATSDETTPPSAKKRRMISPIIVSSNTTAVGPSSPDNEFYHRMRDAKPATEISSVAQWQEAQINNGGAAPSANRCVPLKSPVPSKFWGDVERFKDSHVPDFHRLVNFPDYLPKNRPPPADGMRCCVMCGMQRLCTASISKTNTNTPKKSDKQNTTHIIPRQNKGLCTSCDVAVWVVQSSGLEIKWCKGCKNFRPWAAFGDKGLATKCVRCRDRQREKYALQKDTKKRTFDKEDSEMDAARGLSNLLSAAHKSDSTAQV